MKRFGLQAALSCIPIAGFPVVLVCGIIDSYRVAGERKHAIDYALWCLIPLAVFGLSGAGGVYLILRNISRSNIPLVLSLCLLLIIVVFWAIAWTCLFVRARFIKYITAKNQQGISL